jgi:hypothetical protein
MKNNLFLLIAMTFITVSLMAQTPKKIVAPSIAILMPEKVEVDAACEKITKKPAYIILAINPNDTTEEELDTLDMNYAVNKAYKASEQRAKPIMDKILKKPIPGFLLGSIAIAIQESIFTLEGHKVVFMDTILSADLEIERQFARKNKVRFILNPQKFSANKQGEYPNISLGMILYDSLTHKNSVIENINSNDKHTNVFTQHYIRSGICRPRGDFMADFLCHSERVLSITTDTIMYKMFYDDKIVQAKINLQQMKIAKTDSLFKAKPDPKILELLMPVIESEYQNHVSRYKNIDGSPSNIEHYTEKDCYNASFNADKTKFIAFFTLTQKEPDYSEETPRRSRSSNFVVADKTPSAFARKRKVSENQKMIDVISPRIYTGIFENGKWYIGNGNNFNMALVEKDLLSVQKQEFFGNTVGLLQDTSLAMNPEFWYKNRFRSMQGKIAELAQQIKDEERNDAFAEKQYSPDYIQKEIDKITAKLKTPEGKRGKNMLKQNLKFYKKQLEEIKKQPKYEPMLGRADRFQEEYTFYKNEYPKGYELVMKMQLDSIKNEINNLENILEDTEIEPFLAKLKQKRPDLYQEADNWDLSTSSSHSILSNKKHYFLTTTEVIGERKRGGVFKHHYLLLDIENKKWYEWTYPETNKPNIPAKDQWRADAVFEQLAKWNHYYPTLSDADFWANYVLKQADGKYLHLKPVFE